MFRNVSLVAATAALLAASAASQTCNEALTILPNDVEAGKNYGWSVAKEGNTIVVGAPNDDEAATLAGAAYVFDADTGAQRFKLMASDAQYLDTFGESVAIHGTTAVVGMERSSSPAFGAVYLFDTVTGAELNKLVPTPATVGSGFGHAVDMNAQYIVVGAPFDDAARLNGGAVYVYNANTGAQLHQLLPPGSVVWYGYSVALHGSMLAVGSPRDTPAWGAVRLYDLTTGQQVARYTASDAATNDYFGEAVDLDATHLVAGAPQNIGNGSYEGAAYVFDLASGTEIQRLTSDGPAFEQFGAALALDGSSLVVGAPWDQYNPRAGAGSAYLFDLNVGPQQQSKLFPSDGRSYVQSSHIGATVALDGGAAVVGAPGTHQSIVNAGAVYSFVVDTGECWQAHQNYGALGSNGFVELRGSGPLSSGSTVILEVSNAVPNAPIFLVVGLNELLISYKGGILVPTIDLLIAGLVTDGQGRLTLTGQYPIGVAPIPLYFQSWNADPGAVKGMAGSRGLLGTIY